jgi:hypothetical protein
MMAENISIEESSENTRTPQNQGNDPNGGIATETQGRKDNPGLYENDVFGRVIKRNKDSIWKRGNMKRIKHKEDE